MMHFVPDDMLDFIADICTTNMWPHLGLRTNIRPVVLGIVVGPGMSEFGCQDAQVRKESEGDREPVVQAAQ